jgi:TetR/AcrR family transcriptional regulator, transcriptional repressor for nem operon
MLSMPIAAIAPTADRILDAAERLVQIRGYNAFSYADIAAELRIRKASIHYHFPSKSNLGHKLVARHRKRLLELLAAIDASTSEAPARLRRYADLWTALLRDRNRMCLCGMLAADSATLPLSIRRELRAFFDANERWLTLVLSAGRKARSLRLRASPDIEARLLLMAFEGAMLIARTYGEPERFEDVVENLLAGLSWDQSSQ